MLSQAPAPMLAQLESRPPVGERWRYEPKLDGFRGRLWRRANEQVQLLSRNGRDLAPWFPELVRAAVELPHATLLDGEIVISDDTGAAEFGRLQERLSIARKRVADGFGQHPAVLVVFDVLELAGADWHTATSVAASENSSSSSVWARVRTAVGFAGNRWLLRPEVRVARPGRISTARTSSQLANSWTGGSGTVSAPKKAIGCEA